MYVSLKSGKTAVIGKWPTVEETQEIDKSLPEGLGYDDKVVVVLDGERPATLNDLLKFETRVKNMLIMKTRQKRTRHKR